MKKLQVVAAVLLHQGQVLCVQRGEHASADMRFKFEFPGGKIEPNESPEQALTREIEEELCLHVEDWRYLMTTEHQNSARHLTMQVFYCEVPTTDLTLTEHVQSQWSDRRRLAHWDWAVADLPIVEALLKSDLI